MVLERRSQVGGSAMDYRASDGLIVQKYGPHIFHTNSQKVWDYVTRFGGWRPIKYKVGARVGEQVFRLPLDFDMVRRVYPFFANDIIERLTKRFGLGARVSIPRLREEAPVLADWAIDHVFRGYNEKHWGMPFEEVPASVLARLPFVVGEQESYFTDKYQAVPEDGYTAMVERMLDHPNIELTLNCEAASLQGSVWTGSPDAFFGEAGALPYRSVSFGHYTEVHPRAWPEDYATITEPGSALRATRITNMLRVNGAPGKCYASREVWDYPEAYVLGKNDPFYPIPLEANIRKAQEFESRRPKNVWFAGRLGTYNYINMDQAVAQGLALAERIRQQ
jgi:UDP-galactopyranose mutase